VTESSAVANQAAERYASALFDLAEGAGELDRAAADLAAFVAALAASPDLRRLAQSPLYDAETKAKGMVAVAEGAGLSPLIRKFLGMVASNRRAGDLAEIAAVFRAMVDSARGHTRARVASAAPLSDAQTASLKSSLRAALGRDVELDQTVDPSLLAGLRVRVGSRLFDSSLRSRLQGLRTSMKEA
jgi:F-type H+-transporting ATPase subunit delta